MPNLALRSVLRADFLISPLVLDKVVEYFHYSYQYKDSDNVKEEMVIPVELCLDLLTASYFLGLQ